MDTNACKWCGEEFEVGGRGRPPKDQRFCSRRCMSLARVHNPTVKVLAPLDAAYLAGLYDGEGSLIIAKAREARNTWRLVIASCDKDVLEWCKDVTGVGTLVSKPVYSPNHNPSWSWQCYSWNAKEVIEQILPYLKMLRRKERAVMMINELQTLRNKGG